MVNSELLNARIKNSGLKIGHIAKTLNLSRSGLYLKLRGERSFTPGEIAKLCGLLNIKSLKERDNIFFARNVSKSDTAQKP